MSNAKHLSFGTEIWELGKPLKHKLARLASELRYLTPSGKSEYPITVTMWVFCDLETSTGRKLVETALEFLAESATHSRVAIIPTDRSKCSSKQEFLAAVNANNLSKAMKLLQSFDQSTCKEDSNFAESDHAQLMKLVGISKGENSVVANGRVIDDITEENVFERGDWTLLEKFNYDNCAKHFGTQLAFISL